MKPNDEIIFFSDEAGIDLDAQLGTMWALKGKQPKILTTSPYGRINLIGFVDPFKGRLIINRIDRGNSDVFIEQLKWIKNRFRRYRKITVYVDNAKWHKTQKVVNWLMENTRLNLMYLPKYAPEVNPMERHWWYLRKRKTKNTVFESKEECLSKIHEHVTDLRPSEIRTICQI
jgi:transposase